MISVVIPCYKVRAHIIGVIAGIPEGIGKIYVVDDLCPEQTGQFVRETCRDPRVTVIFNGKNLGVGGAVKAGYLHALADGADIIVKLDGDGQMNPALITRLVEPILAASADYVKGNRFYDLAFLRAMPEATATIFDLPDAIDQARERLAGTEFADRVTLVAGDFYIDVFPDGVDFAWVSAICHQHSRGHNRDLFAKVFRALVPGGRIALRDMVMELDRTGPREGALFAVNMLVNTESGGTFTLAEYAEDLRSAGFDNPQLLVKHEAMNSVVVAEKP